MNASPPEKLTAYQTHREGIRKLYEWEDHDFDLARHESHLCLFDDPDGDAPEGAVCRDRRLSPA